MAEGIRISQLPTITAMTDDDNLIVNDGNSATSRITYANFKSEISGAIAGVNTINGQSGNVIIDASSLGVYTVQQTNDLVVTKASNALIGVVNGSTDLGAFTGTTIPANVTVRAALQSLESAIEAGDAQDAILTGDNTFTGQNTFQGTITAAQNGNIIPFYFDSQVQFPSATESHGAIAHSHADGKMFFAHGGAWVELAVAGEGDDFDATNYYTIDQVDAALADKFDISGGSLTGLVDAGAGLLVSGVTSSGASLSVDGILTASSAQLGTNLSGVAVPFVATNDQDVTTKKYVDDAITAAGSVDLSAYYTSAEVDTALTSYYTSAEVDTALASYYTSAQVDTTLASYYTSAEVDTALTSYYTSAQVDTTLASYYTSAQVDTALAGKVDTTALADYSTTTEANALYATVAQGALADTSVQPTADAITVTTLATDGSETVDTLATAINTLTAQLAAVLNA